MDQESHSLQRWQSSHGDNLVRAYRKAKPAPLPGYMTMTPSGLECAGTYNGKCDRFEGPNPLGTCPPHQLLRYQPQGYKHLRRSVAVVKNSPYDTEELRQQALQASADSKAEYQFIKSGLKSSMGGAPTTLTPRLTAAFFFH